VSRVYFTSRTEEAELHGSERAWMGVFLGDLTVGIVTPLSSGADAERMKELLPPDHYLHRTFAANWPDWRQSFRAAWVTDLTLDWQGHHLSSWDLSLNTALALGNDVMKFFARVHGTCEIHGWVDGPNRAWLADIITDGLTLGLCRREMGWESIIKMLRSRDDKPVVMSYSVCDGFPNAEASDWMPAWPEGKPRQWDALSQQEQDDRDERAEAWGNLPPDEQWSRGLCWLREHDGLEMKPDGWQEFRFGSGLTALDLIAPDRDERFAAALGKDES